MGAPLMLRRGRANLVVRLGRRPEPSWQVLLTNELARERSLLGVAIVLNDLIAIQPMPSDLDDALAVVDRLIDTTNRRYVSEVLTRRARADLLARLKHPSAR